MNIIFPWLTKNWQQLISYKKNIPSGILITAPPGIGELIFASEYAKFILCQKPNENACDECRSCVLFKAGNHPDYFFIQAEEKSSNIKIDQIRDLIDTLEQTPILGGYQVALISLAENMNRAAANALLKTLEEPRGQVLILLLSHRPTAVAATVRSRCQQIKLSIPKKSEAKLWLKNQTQLGEAAENYLSVVDYLPLKVAEYINSGQQQLRDKIIVQLQQIKNNELDPILVGAECAAYAPETVQFLITFILDMIKIKFCAKEFLLHHDKITTLTQLCHDLTMTYLFKFLDSILEAKKLLLYGNNVNMQLLMEKIFINWRYNNDVS